LVVNTEEARQVQAIFALYLQHRSLEAVLAEIQSRQWTTKRWRTREGHEHLGRSFTKPILVRPLRNLVYRGKVSHQNEIYAGEQEAIVEQEIWERAQEALNREQTARANAASNRTSQIALSAPKERVPRITRLLALAQKFEELIESGGVNNYAALAQAGHVSRSRVTQMTSLLNLAPDIQEQILFLGVKQAEQFRISEPSLRKLSMAN
jgi:hypothetical protein